jgi:hypothetical protein
MTLALGGSPEAVEFGFPGRCCDVRWVELELLGQGDGSSPVLWRIEAERPGAPLPFPARLGRVPDGYRETVPFRADNISRLASEDAKLGFTTSVGLTTAFRLSELSATGRVVQLEAGSRSVSRFSSMREYRADYLEAQAKEQRGNHRALAAWIAAGLLVFVLLIRRSRRRPTPVSSEIGSSGWIEATSARRRARGRCRS